MKKQTFHTIILTSVLVACAACGFLDPLPSGEYNEENLHKYPELIRGYVDKVYDQLPIDYNSGYYMLLSAATDDAVHSSPTNIIRRFSTGDLQMTNNPFTSKWTHNYFLINYCNMFLQDSVGFKTRYMVAEDSDLALRRRLQGGAYGLRAWLYYDLLKVFGGKGADGRMLGVPLRLEATEASEIDPADIKRATFDECVKQILDDCDAACRFLPFNNRDYPGDPVQSVQITGSALYKTLDQVAIDGIRAMVYLTWASPAYNPTNDMSRYEKAAEYAAKVMRHKLEKESTLAGGFDPTKGFSWHQMNSPELVWPSEMYINGSMESALYPKQFGGSATYAPTQELVDAFPMANGYPITDPRSGYDSSRPYEGRDPRFYASIFFNEAKAVNSNNKVLYTFDTAEGGQDAPGSDKVSPTGYYIKKFIYPNWNSLDETVETGYRCIHNINWTKMCLTFAEAASKTTSPLDATKYGYSAKQALAWLRHRPTTDNTPGISAAADHYLEECAADPAAFEALVKNEWYVVTCFEGERWYNLRRWATSASELGMDIHGVKISGEKGNYTYEYPLIETLTFASQWNPLPYTEIRRCPNLLQNEGWEGWK